MRRKPYSLAAALRMYAEDIAAAQDRLSAVAEAAGLPPSPTVIVTMTRDQLQSLRHQRVLTTDDIIE